MSYTDPSTGAGSFPYDSWGLSGQVDVVEDWDAFDQEWSYIKAAHNYEPGTLPNIGASNALPMELLADPLSGGDWTELLASDSDFMDSPQNPILFPVISQPETVQLYSPTQVDDGIQPNFWYTPPSISGSETPPHSSSNARFQQPSSTQNVNYSCNYCQKSYAKRHDLNRHTKLHTKPEACPVNGCNYKTAKKKEINRHLVAKHPDQHVTQPLLAAPVIRCTVPGCGFVQEGARRKDNLKRHMRNKHAREVP